MIVFGADKRVLLIGVGKKLVALLVAGIAMILLCGCMFSPPQMDYSKHTSEELSDYGVVYEKAGNLKEAERLYRKALDRNPANHIALSNLANIYHQMGTSSKATNCYQKAIAICPDYVPALNNLANVQIETEDYVSAEKNLQKAIELAETREEKRAIYLSFVSLYSRIGDEEKSAQWAEKAKEIKPLTIISHVPFFKQSRYDCGPAALACVYNFFGVKQSPEEISERIYDEKQKGSLNLKLLIDAREQGLTATIYSGSFENVKEAIDNETPLILMLSENGSSLHYVVVVGYEGNDLDEIIVHDGYESYKRYSREILEKKWSATGYCAIEIKKQR